MYKVDERMKRGMGGIEDGWVDGRKGSIERGCKEI